MATNRELRRALLRKLGVTPQGLSHRVQKKIKQLPMNTSEATYVIAHDEGLRLGDYLTQDELANVRHLQAQLRQAGPAPTPFRENGGYRRAKQKGPRELKFGNKVKVASTMLSA